MGSRPFSSANWLASMMRAAVQLDTPTARVLPALTSASSDGIISSTGMRTSSRCSRCRSEYARPMKARDSSKSPSISRRVRRDANMFFRSGWLPLVTTVSESRRPRLFIHLPSARSAAPSLYRRAESNVFPPSSTYLSITSNALCSQSGYPRLDSPMAMSVISMPGAICIRFMAFLSGESLPCRFRRPALSMPWRNTSACRPFCRRWRRYRRRGSGQRACCGWSRSAPP